jgi:tetratricopeptide (TPR) repeat protein
VEKIEALAAGYDFRGDVAADRPEAAKGFHRSLETISATSLQEAARSRRKLQLTLVAGAVLALAGAGAWFGPRWLAPAPAPVARSAPAPAAVAVAAAPAPAPVVVSAPVPAPAPVVPVSAAQPHLDEAAAAFARGDLVTPAGRSAADGYRAALAAEPDNAAARAGLDQVATALQARVLAGVQKHDMGEAQRNLEALRKLTPDNPALPDLAQAVAAARATPRPAPAPAPASPAAPLPPAAASNGSDGVAREAPVITVVPAAKQGDDSEDDSAAQQAAYNRLRLSASLALARRALATGNFAQAILRYQTALDIDPDNAEAKEGMRKAVAGNH